MSILRTYRDYLKDNPQGFWFKRKLYGWGWTPAKWQGWAIILVFILFVLWTGFDLASYKEPTNTQLFWFFAKLVIAVFILIAICYKTGEKPRFQWGLPKNGDSI